VKNALNRFRRARAGGGGNFMLTPHGYPRFVVIVALGFGGAMTQIAHLCAAFTKSVAGPGRGRQNDIHSDGPRTSIPGFSKRPLA